MDGWSEQIEPSDLLSTRSDLSVVGWILQCFEDAARLCKADDRYVARARDLIVEDDVHDPRIRFLHRRVVDERQPTRSAPTARVPIECEYPLDVVVAFVNDVSRQQSVPLNREESAEMAIGSEMVGGGGFEPPTSCL